MLNKVNNIITERSCVMPNTVVFYDRTKSTDLLSLPPFFLHFFSSFLLLFLTFFFFFSQWKNKEQVEITEENFKEIDNVKGKH